MPHFSIPRVPYQPIIHNPDDETHTDTDFPLVNTTMDFNPFAPISSFLPPTDDSLPFDTDWFSDTDSDSERDVNCFVTNLFDNRRLSDNPPALGDHNRDFDSSSDLFPHSVNELGISGFEDNGDMESNYVEEIWSTFGVDSESRVSDRDLGLQVVDSINNGLRIVDVDSDSDSDNGMVGGVNDVNWVAFSSPPSDSFFFQGQRIVYDDLEWEEVEERVDDRESLNFVVDRAEELSLASGFSNEEELGEETGRNLEWEILLVMNNIIERNTNEERDNDSEPYLVQDDYMYAAEYDTLFGQFVENENALKGSPPAAKSAVENLPLVELKMEDLPTEVVVCAVCKDRISLEEKVRKLPCCHYYHDDCILPWLNIRNTCPVCRYELPTDDPDYERRKSRRASGGLSMDFQVRYNFELIA